MPEGSADRAILVPWLWDVLAAGIVVGGATLLQRGEAPWVLPPRYYGELWAMAASHLAIAVYLARLPRRGVRAAFPRILVSAAAVFLSAYLALVALRSIGNTGASRGLIATGFGISVLLATVRAVEHRRGRILVPLATLLGLALGVPVVRTVKRTGDATAEVVKVISTGLLTLEVRTQPGLTGPALGDGGAIVRLGSGYLVVTGRGTLFRMRHASSESPLLAERLSLPPPMDRSGYLADQPDSAAALRLRVTGMAIDTTVTPIRIYLAHEVWRHTEKCFALRVSSAAVTAAGVSTMPDRPWTTEFESQPCLPPTKGFDDIETGGRIALTADHALLLTTGDFGYDGVEVPDFPQDSASDYGKVFRRDPVTRRWQQFTRGHRNPQGLLVDRQGRIWETEHGPQGGDELNLLVAGRNYGWPLVTYGTQYGAHYWPPNPEGRDHGTFAEPAYAFMPSIGISNLIEISGTAFPEWEGDLMLSSLKDRSLWRTRLRDGHAIYVEQIFIGRRIRDLVQGANGEIEIWTDEGDMVTVMRSRQGSTPESAFEQCRGCHEAARIGTALAPTLKGAFGREVASLTDYSYSNALRHVGGRWSPERLDSFLRDPMGFAPGTRMSFGGVKDSDERRKVIEYLRKF
ncbi:MAG: PQQ-dependent sugar dehydrogenase [Gemmatimonadota bacterium]